MSLKLKNGDEVEVGGVKYTVVDDEFFKVDPRSPLEKKVDDLEERIATLEAQGQYKYLPPNPFLPLPLPAGTKPFPYPNWNDTTSNPWYSETIPMVWST